MTPTKEQGPRISDDLVAELLGKRPDLQNFIDALQDHFKFFSELANSEFGVSAPTDLMAQGADHALVYRAQLQFFHRILTLRTAALLPEVVLALNDSRLLTFALAARGILETAAVAAYHAPRLVLPADEKQVPADYSARLRAAVMGSRFDWLTLFTDHAARQALIGEYDRAKDWSKLYPADAATNILTMLEALARRLNGSIDRARGLVFHDYSLLSDMSHPAAGSYMLFLSGVEPQMRADLLPPRTTVLALAELVLPCVGYSISTIVEVLAELEGMDQRLEGARPARASGAQPDGAAGGPL